MTDDDLGKDLTCFIVGPIGDRLEPLGTPGRQRYEDATQMWENVFEPACKIFGMSPVRADKIAEAGEIPEQIFTYLRDADVVIADLTGGNSNVMYELGLRHTRDKITIQIGEHERLPFDVNTIRTVKFKRSEAGLIEARNSLVESLRSALQGSGTPVTATRVWSLAGDILSRDEIAKASALSFTTEDPADVVDDEGPGMLERLAEGETAVNEIAGILEAFTADMAEMAEVTTRLTPELDNSPSYASKMTVVKQVADGLKGPSASMDENSGVYLQNVEKADSMISILVTQLESSEEPIDPDEIAEFAESLVGFSESTQEANVQLTEFLQVVRDMRKWSTLLRPASKSIEHSLNTMLRGNAIVQGWAVKFIALRDDVVE
jgi:hypothetical protein